MMGSVLFSLHGNFRQNCVALQPPECATHQVSYIGVGLEDFKNKVWCWLLEYMTTDYRS